jgi:uncharacterized damage-inducible protein DinB
MTVEPEYLISGFSGNAGVVGRLTEDITHIDSLLVPSYGGNNLNWILGHIVLARHRVLKLLELEPLWEEEKLALYETGSERITEAQAVALESLLADLETTSGQIASVLGDKSFADMALALPSESEDQPPSTLGQTLLGLYWHESYHIGQMELLRRVAGKKEKVFG